MKPPHPALHLGHQVGLRHDLENLIAEADLADVGDHRAD